MPIMTGMNIIMDIDRSSRSFRIVMIECILMFGVFAVMSVVIAKMFLSADHMSKEAVSYSQAVIRAENIAERLKGSDSFETVLVELGMKKVVEGDRNLYQGYYGRDWEPAKDRGMYEITVDVEKTSGSLGNLEKAEIVAARVKKPAGGGEAAGILCSLNVSKFIYN
ncbi:MAG TPA: hypothetical protein GXX75_25065 [Clostridiales bacterium]|nr:hypothetical protein [Clostridiales bacterium]